jgi:hypothetical protein
MSDDERRLDPDAMAQLRCTETSRRMALNRPGVVAESEAVSQSEEFGYVYRYDIVHVLQEGGESHTCRSVLVQWSKDCETFYIATYSAYQLPVRRRE